MQPFSAKGMSSLSVSPAAMFSWIFSAGWNPWKISIPGELRSSKEQPNELTPATKLQLNLYGKSAPSSPYAHHWLGVPMQPCNSLAEKFSQETLTFVK